MGYKKNTMKDYESQNIILLNEIKKKRYNGGSNEENISEIFNLILKLS